MYNETFKKILILRNTKCKQVRYSKKKSTDFPPLKRGLVGIEIVQKTVGTNKIIANEAIFLFSSSIIDEHVKLNNLQYCGDQCYSNKSPFDDVRNTKKYIVLQKNGVPYM